MARVRECRNCGNMFFFPSRRLDCSIECHIASRNKRKRAWVMANPLVHKENIKKSDKKYRTINAELVAARLKIYRAFPEKPLEERKQMVAEYLRTKKEG